MKLESKVLAQERISILYVLSELMYGSKVRQLCDLVNGLDTDRFDVKVGCLEIGNEATSDVEALGVPVFQMRLYPPRSIDTTKVRQFLRVPSVLLKSKYDIVHSLLYQSIFVEPFLIKTFTGAKYVYTKTNLEWDNHWINWHLKSMLADRIVSISGATDALLESKGYSKKTEKIYLGIDTEKFVVTRSGVAFRKELGIDDNIFVFGCAAQFVEWKNHDILLDAFELLCERYSDIALLMCGANHRDAYFDKIVDRVSSSTYLDRMSLLGTFEDMPRFYSALNCFVLPSNNETFGYVYIEAMSCNLPVIGCNIGGPLDIIDPGENGFLVEPSDVGDLMNAMEAYLVKRQRAVEHGAKGRKKVVDNFSKAVMSERHVELYLNIGHRRQLYSD